MHVRLLSLIVFLGCITLLSGCSTTTLVTDYVRHNDAQPSDHVFVLAISSREPIRVAIEEGLKNQFEKMDVKATASHTVLFELPESKAERIALIKDMVAKSGASSVLLVSLINVTTKEDYVPARMEAVPVYYSPVATPYGYGGLAGYGSFYHETVQYVYQPGYYDTYKDYRVLSQWFGTGSEKPAWEGESSTVDPSSLDNAINGYAKVVTSALKEHGLLVSASQ